MDKMKINNKNRVYIGTHQKVFSSKHINKRVKRTESIKTVKRTDFYNS